MAFFIYFFQKIFWMHHKTHKIITNSGNWFVSTARKIQNKTKLLGFKIYANKAWIAIEVNELSSCCIKAFFNSNFFCFNQIIISLVLPPLLVTFNINYTGSSSLVSIIHKCIMKRKLGLKICKPLTWFCYCHGFVIVFVLLLSRFCWRMNGDGSGGRSFATTIAIASLCSLVTTMQKK